MSTQIGKTRVVEAYCELSALVAEHVFKHNRCADCFCGRFSVYDFRHGGSIYEWIKDAIVMKLRTEKEMTPEQIYQALDCLEELSFSERSES